MKKRQTAKTSKYLTPSFVSINSVNFGVPLTGKTMKVPKEHTCSDWSCYLPEGLRLKATSCETEEPSDVGTTQGNSRDSGQKGGQTIPDTGKPAAPVSKSQTGSNSYSRGSGSSGGDDEDDGRRPKVPVGSCQGDSQCSANTSEEHEPQPEEQSHQGGDCPHNQDSETIPSSTGNGLDKTDTSSPKVGQTPTDGGTPAAQVSKSLTRSNNHCCSSHSSGEDDEDDGQRQDVSVSGCQKECQCSVDDSKEHEQQPEEQSHQGGGCPHNQDSMDIPTKAPSDTGNSDNNTSTSNQKVGHTPTDGGKPAAQVSKIQQGSTSYRHSSSASGGDDGGEDRKRNFPRRSCQGDGQCEVDDLEETESSEQDDHQEEEQSPLQITESILVSVPSCDGTKRSAAQVSPS